MNLDQNEALRRFATARRAQLATVDAHGQPHIVPVTFAVDGDHVYIAVDSKPKRSTDLKRLRNIAENPRVAVLADEYSDDWSRLWWARGDGEARVLTAEPGRRGPIELLQARYPQYLDDAPEGPVIDINVNRWSGWAFADTVKLPA